MYFSNYNIESGILCALKHSIKFVGVLFVCLLSNGRGGDDRWEISLPSIYSSAFSVCIFAWRWKFGRCDTITGDDSGQKRETWIIWMLGRNLINTSTVECKLSREPIILSYHFQRHPLLNVNIYLNEDFYCLSTYIKLLMMWYQSFLSLTHTHIFAYKRKVNS